MTAAADTAKPAPVATVRPVRSAPDAAQCSPAPPAHEASLTRVQKLAVLLFMLGPDTAAEVLKHFDEKELEAVSAEMVRINIVSQELQAEVLREFTQVAAQAGGA